MIGLCVDSGAELPPGLIERFAIEVVPLTVSIGGRDHLEGVDLDADGFYAAFEDGASPTVATAAPSPGRFLAAYSSLVERGATEVVSVHTGSAVSATFDAARLAAAEAAVPVRLVDTGAASFIVGLAAWAAADVLAARGTAEQAAQVAEAVGRACGNVFVVGALDLARSGGRLVADTTATGVPVLALDAGQVRAVGDASDLAAAVELLAAEVEAAGPGLRVGVGHGDAGSADIADALVERLAQIDPDGEVVRYRVGPSVGAHTGPGTAGAVYHPLDLVQSPVV